MKYSRLNRNYSDLHVNEGKGEGNSLKYVKNCVYTYHNQDQVKMQTLAKHPKIVDQHKIVYNQVETNAPGLKKEGR